MSYRCQRCDKEWSSSDAADNEFSCTRKCGGLLGQTADIALAPTSGQAQSTTDLSTLPSIIARPLYEFLIESHPVQRLWHLCDAVELTLRLAVIAGVSELSQRGSLSPELLRELRPLIEEPTLGKWRKMAATVVKALPENSVLLELRSLVGGVLAELLDGNPQTRVPEKSLSSLRNRLAHGGGMTTGVATRLLSGWAPKVVQLLDALAWLSDASLVVRSASGALGRLRGPQGQPVPWQSPAAIADSVAACFERGDEVLLVRGDQTLTLWPLTLFGVPKSPDPDSVASEETVQQVYDRRGDVRLRLTPLGSETFAASETDDASFDAFGLLFRLDAPEIESREKGVKILGFERELRREAGKLIGRERELDTIRRKLLECGSQGVLWMTGHAGIGKSLLMARIATELFDDPPANTFVLAFRFKNGDDRCNRVSFLRFAVERVKAFLHHTTEAETAENDNSAQKLLAELRGLLKQQIGANRVIFILDGLDEIAEREPMFASEVPLAIALPGVVWLCAGRSERGLEKAFAGDSVIPIFAEGVPPMDENEVRSMLLEKIGPLRKRLVANDFETGEKVSNAFVTKVTTCAQGLPLYVSYVIGDILLNRLRVLDAGERLAPSLDAYHRELLHRCSVGILQQVMTPLVATIAVAKEPLSAQALADLLVRDNRIPDDNEALPRVRQSLGAVVSIVRRATTPDGEQRFTIYHHSIRQHMEASTEMAPALSTARRNLSTLALSPSSGSASLYLYRHGIAHLLESGKREDALNLLTNFDYLMSRLRALPGADGISGLLADWLSASTGILSDEQRIWAAFVRERANILRRGDDIWPSFKILLQQAVEHAGASPVTLAAESWIAEGHCDWIWLRNAQRVELVPIQPCIATFEGHTEAVTGALILPDDNVLSWSEDKTLRVWDGKSFCCRTTLVGHDGGVRGALLLPADRVLSWANDRSPRIWNYQSGECQAVLSGHTRATRGALLLPDGNLVTWAEDHALRVWDAVTGACLATLEGHADWIRGALILDNDTLVSWSDDKTLRIWDTKNYVCHRTFVGHTGWVWGALVLSGAELLSWSRDGSMRRWDISSGECRTTFQGHEKWVRGAIVLDHESCLSWSDDNSLRTWDLHSGKCRHVMEGHVSEVTGALVLEDGDILSWSTPNADSILRIWDVASGTCKKILDHHRQPVEQAMQLDDGRILSWSADKSLRLWDSSAGILARSLEGHEWPVSGVIVLSRDRVLSWSRDSTLRVWDIAIGASSSNLEGHRGGILQLRSMPDGSILSWSSDPYGSDNLLRIWDVESGSCRTSLDGHSKYIAGVLVLRDARVLSWSWLDEPMRISSAASVACRTMGTGSDGRTLGALELPDGTVASWADDQTVRIWDVDLGECRLTLQGHTSVADGVLSLPSGDLLSWSAEERALRIWDMSTGECRLTLNGHTDRVWDAGILPDGSILSRSADSTIRVWDASNGICTHVIDETVAEVERPDLAAAAWSDAPWFATRPRELDSRHPRACSLSNKGGVFAEWHATGACRGSEALASGTAVATLDEGHVYFLKLYAGAERVTLEEAERILTSAVVPT